MTNDVLQDWWTAQVFGSKVGCVFNTKIDISILLLSIRLLVERYGKQKWLKWPLPIKQNIIGCIRNIATTSAETAYKTIGTQTRHGTFRKGSEAMI